MSHTWKPGDVAMVRGDGDEDVVAIWQGTQWATEHANYFSDFQVNARPLVVIDPEDREQVERLTADYDAAVIRMNNDPDPRDVTPAQRATAMQAALRSLIVPPKPDEPTGLGAVVEDADGDRWVRVETAEPGDPCWFFNAREEDAACCHYSDIAAVKVLSEGVR